jgi:hypothetical protein
MVDNRWHPMRFRTSLKSSEWFGPFAPYQAALQTLDEMAFKSIRFSTVAKLVWQVILFIGLQWESTLEGLFHCRIFYNLLFFLVLVCGVPKVEVTWQLLSLSPFREHLPSYVFRGRIHCIAKERNCPFSETLYVLDFCGIKLVTY